jgi:cupin fold WbuC family metalloprotein
MIPIDKKILDRLVSEARNNPRRRKHYNFHKSYDEPVQRLLNAIEPDSYIRPHMHKNPDKTEIFLVLRGSFLVITFNEDGSIANRNILKVDEEQYGVEISPGIYHTIISLEPGSVAYEIKNGPFDVSVDKKFASWAPEEGTEEGLSYIKSLKKEFID